MNPDPSVVIVAPRVFWNTVNGVPPGDGVVAPPPSQLISRRPPTVPGAFPLFGLPRASRKASTVAWMSPAARPDAPKTIGEAWAVFDRDTPSSRPTVRARRRLARSLIQDPSCECLGSTTQ